jgi:ATPase family associated with various cellular activities (AAA)
MKSRSTMSLKHLALSAIVAAAGNAGATLDLSTVAIDNICVDVSQIRLKPTLEDGRMVQLAQALQFEDFELLVLAMLFAVETDPAACRLVGATQAPLAGARPTLGLLATGFHMFGSTGHLMALLTSGAGRNSGCFVIGSEDAPLPEKSISIAPAILDALSQGTSAPQSVRLLSHASHPMPKALLAEVKKQSEQLSARANSGIVIRTNAEAEAVAVASLVAQQVGKKAALVMPDAPAVLSAWLVASNAIPVFHAYVKPGERRVIPDLHPYSGPWLCVTGRDGLVETGGAMAVNWTLPACAESERQQLWRANGMSAETAGEVAHALRIGARRIAMLAAATTASCGGLAKNVNPGDIAKTVSRDAQASLAGLAQKLDGAVDDAAFVRPKLIAERLQLLLGRCRLREGLVSRLGPAATARYHPGVRALFHGVSGTGKSLAAQWLATGLRLPIYRVDLAAVTSKWIGETEKNIGQLLSAAEEADVILLFDEADSLFSARTDVGNANDRHANSQTNYLLQRLESHEGIVILTSNARERLDGAFTRRLDAIIEFPLPDVEARRDIWRAHLPEKGLLEYEINHLAAVIDLAGGHVRNLVLSAAVLSRGEAPSMPHLIAAAKAEYQKLGRQVPRELEQP